MNDLETGSPRYGDGDVSFQAAGGEAGLRPLVDRFYDLIDERPDAARMCQMHPQDLEVSRDKLTRFLCGWLGGPKRYAQKYGPIQIPKAHAHLPISRAERDVGLACMEAALIDQPMAKAHLLRELGVPGERICQLACALREAEHE